MKKLLFSIFFFLLTFTGSSLALLSPNNQVHAQTPIEINIGDVAKDRDIVGTANYEPDDGEAGFAALLGQVLGIVATIAVIILLIMLLWGGIEWITAGGDKSKIEKARNRITQSILGIIVLAAVVVLFMIVQNLLGFQLFEFSS